MRPAVRLLIALLIVLPILPSVQAQAGAPAARMEPASFEWDDYSHALAHYFVNVTNPSGATDAFTITEIRIEPKPVDPQGREVPTANIYSPTPTLVLGPGATGTFHVWVGGFDQPSPPGPKAGEHRVDVRVVSTTDPAKATTVSALLRRSFPQDPSDGAIEGTVTDAATGGPPAPGLRVHAADPASVRVLSAERTTTMVDAQGRFHLSLPAGTYWLRVEGGGYRTAFVRDLPVTAGSTVAPGLSVFAANEGYKLDIPDKTASMGLPTYRAASDINLRVIAAMPGFYTKQPGHGAERFGVYLSDGSERWRSDLPPETVVPFDNPQWTSSDGGVDVSIDGRSIVVGTSGGTVSLYETSSPSAKWTFAGPNTQNPLVPGPLGQGAKRVSEVRVSPDLQTVAAGTLTGAVYLLDAETGQPRWIRHTGGQVRAIRYAPGTERLWVGSGDNRLYLLDASDGRILKTADLTFWPWEHIGVSADGDRIVTGGKDGILRVFDGDANLQWSRRLPGFILGFDIAPGDAPVVAMGENGVYAFSRTGTLQWFRGEIQNAGKLMISGSSRFVSYGKASTSVNEPTARVVGEDGTLLWEFRAGATPETVYNVLMRDDGELLVANGRSGNLYFFNDWQQDPGPGPTGSGTGTGESSGGRRGGSASPGLALLLVGVAGALLLARRRRDG